MSERAIGYPALEGVDLLDALGGGGHDLKVSTNQQNRQLRGIATKGMQQMMMATLESVIPRSIDPSSHPIPPDTGGWLLARR